MHPPEIVRPAPGTHGIAAFGETVLEGCDEAGRPLRCTEVKMFENHWLKNETKRKTLNLGAIITMSPTKMG